MATLKHINSKNADYGAAEQYLLFEHDEFTMKPVLDESGRLIPREDYRLSTLNCGGEDFAIACMHTTNEFVTAAVNANHAEGVATWCYFDEFHILLRDPLTASYFVAVWKMLRKKGCVPSALTQNVKDLLASREIENILDNTDFMVLLSQAQSDRTILAKQLGISEHQLSYITHSNSGEGLLFYGNVTIPFVDRFPRGEIYDLLTTRPEDLAHERTDE